MRLAAALLAATPALADADLAAARLTDSLATQAMDGAIAFAFERDGCEGRTVLTQAFDGGTRTVRTVIPLGDLSTDRYEELAFADLDIVQIGLMPVEGAEGFTAVTRIDGGTAEDHAPWLADGGTCDASGCDHTQVTTNLPFLVRGPDSLSRSQFVLADLRTLSDACRAGGSE